MSRHLFIFSVARIAAAVLVGILLPTLLFAASPEPVFAPNGAVVSSSRLASEAGNTIMLEDGNAVDGAVAAFFALAVTLPQAGNIGGGGFAVVHLASGEEFTLDFREKAPAAAHRDMYLDENGDVVEGLALETLLGVGVPGSVDGALRLLDDYGSGKVSRRQVLAPAIEIARKGIHISRYFAAELNEQKELFSRNPGAVGIFVRRDGRPWREGDVLVQTDLAKTLELIAKKGREGFYDGPVAEMIVAEMTRGNGIITREDLRSYRSVYRDPVRGRFMGRDIISMGPPSSGGIHLVQMLNMLELLDIDAEEWQSSKYVHLITEVERRAYADRAEHLGDMDFWDVPIEVLTSVDYAKRRNADVSRTRATPSTEVAAGRIPLKDGENTTHLSVGDRHGNAVAITTTINPYFYTCGIVVDGGGFFLNNEMVDFVHKPGVADYFGLLGNRANAIEPHKRMLSAMTPTIVLEDGRPLIIAGSPGGGTIITTVMQVILNVLANGMNIQEAVHAPRFHSQWFPDTIQIETYALSADTIEVLEGMGHEVVPRGNIIGRAHCIYFGPDGLYVAPDHRFSDSSIVGADRMRVDSLAAVH
jgi:gamma-glutamyltranspeptidase/glutathione hydrolase